jgi:hypothetical protein
LGLARAHRPAKAVGIMRSPGYRWACRRSPFNCTTVLDHANEVIE